MTTFKKWGHDSPAVMPKMPLSCMMSAEWRSRHSINTTVYESTWTIHIRITIIYTLYRNNMVLLTQQSVTVCKIRGKCLIINSNYSVTIFVIVFENYIDCTLSVSPWFYWSVYLARTCASSSSLVCLVASASCSDSNIQKGRSTSTCLLCYNVGQWKLDSKL